MWRAAKLVVALILLAGIPMPAAAEFVELEKLLDEPAKGLAEKLADQKVVVSARELSKIGGEWAMHQAAGVELTMALRRLKIDAVRAAADTRTDKLDTLKTPFAAKDTKPVKDVERTVLVGVEWTSAPKLKLRVVAFQVDQDKSLLAETIPVPSTAGSMEKNLPEMNATVLKFAREQLGKKVGGGGHYELPDAGLKAAGTARRDFLRWGRELGPREPWLPGDILGLEAVGYKEPTFTRKFIHHAAIVEDVRPMEVTVLHQNTAPKGQIVQRETWAFKGLDDAEIVAFRPWAWPEEQPLPIPHPLRVALTKPATGGKGAVVDLFKVIDPRLDRVHAMWGFDTKILKSQGELCARMQVPFVPPKSYLLKLAVKRMSGADLLGLGIVVDGHPAMVTIDGTDGQVTGLGNIDEKPPSDNETLQTVTLLPVGKKVDVECRVEPGRVQLKADGKSIFDWKGEATRLTVPTDYAVPHADWLFLAANGSEFDILSFTLEPLPVK